MALEIERKFLVDVNRLGALNGGRRIVQGYIPTAGTTSVRVRLVDEAAWLTLKGPSRGMTREEFEYTIPVGDAREILARLCDERVIEKTRYLVENAGHTWEVDVFSGANQGLVVAEVELAAESEAVQVPDWATREVTDDPRYRNANLATRPWRDWGGD